MAGSAGFFYKKEETVISRKWLFLLCMSSYHFLVLTKPVMPKNATQSDQATENSEKTDAPKHSPAFLLMLRKAEITQKDAVKLFNDLLKELNLKPKSCFFQAQ